MFRGERSRREEPPNSAAMALEHPPLYRYASCSTPPRDSADPAPSNGDLPWRPSSRLFPRRRPEDVAELVRKTLEGKLDPREARSSIGRRAGSLVRKPLGYTSMLQDFARPRGLVAQVARAATLFATARAPRGGVRDRAPWRRFVRAVGAEIDKVLWREQLPPRSAQRRGARAAGLDVSRRKYNRKFRLLRRMERKIGKLTRETMKLEFTQIGKSGLATRLPRAAFLASESSACFIAYLVARSNLRSEFTIDGQQSAMDEIAAMLLARCRRDARRAGSR